MITQQLIAFGIYIIIASIIYVCYYVFKEAHHESAGTMGVLWPIIIVIYIITIPFKALKFFAEQLRKDIKDN